MYASLVLDFEPASRDTDAALVAAAQAGDRTAFGRLYERYARMVHGVLLAHVPWSDAEDLQQDVFVTALQRLAGLREAAAFGGWLAAIARHAAYDRHRRQKPTVAADEHLPGPGGPSLEAMAVLAEIHRLPEAYRESLTLRLVEGLTGPEIAARIGLTPDSVRVNLHRGMKMLKERLEPQR